MEQVELLPGQLHLFPVHGHPAAVRLQPDALDGEGPLPARGLALGALAQGGADPGQQLLDGEGLGDIVVRPQIQAGHLVHGGVPGGEQDHRQGLVLPADAPQHLQPVEPGQHDVQQHQLVLPGQGHLQPGPSVKGLSGLIALIFQLQFDHAVEFFLILHDQDFILFFFGHGPHPPSILRPGGDEIISSCRASCGAPAPGCPPPRRLSGPSRR